MATAYKYKQLGAAGGACTTVTVQGVPYPVVHMATKGGALTLCSHNLHNVAKLGALRRNWVYVRTPVTCKVCKGAMATSKPASKPRAPKVPKVATTTATATAPVTAPATPVAA